MLKRSTFFLDIHDRSRQSFSLSFFLFDTLSLKGFKTKIKAVKDISAKIASTVSIKDCTNCTRPRKIA